MATVNDVQLRINAGVTGASDISSLGRLVDGLNANLRATGANSATSRTQMETLRNELLRLSSGFAAGSREATRLAQQAAAVQGQLNRMTNEANRADLAAQRLAAAQARAAAAAAAQAAQANSLGGILGRLTSTLGPLNTGLALLGGGAALGGITALIGGFKSLAGESSKVDIANKVLVITAQRYGQSLGDLQSMVQRLAVRFNSLPSDIQPSITTLLRLGFTSEQIEKTLTGAGASAIAFGRNAKDGFYGVESAAASQTSAMLNTIGIAENLAPAYDRMAHSLHKSTDELTAQERAMALTNLVTKATSGEVGVLDTALGGYAGSQGRADRAARDFKLALGEMLTPAVMKLNEAMTPALQQLADFVRLLGQADAHKDIELSLAIHASDSGTVKLMKVLEGMFYAAEQGVDLVVKGVQSSDGVQGGSQFMQALSANQLQKKLIETGVLTAPTNAIAEYKQLRTIMADVDKYAAMLAARVKQLNIVPNGALAVPNGTGIGNDFFRTKVGTTTPQTGVGGLALVNNIGLPNSRRGTPYGGTYFGGEIHNGEDLFAPTGTALEAAFTGYITTRWSKTTGHIVELMDAAGQKLLLGHLDRYAPELEERIKAAGGKLLVKQGELIGYVGQTGSKAHADLGPGNSHAHIMGYDASGKVVDPFSLQFQGFGAGAATSAANNESSRQFDAALIKAKELQVAINNAVKANDPKAWNKATVAMKGWADQSEVNARALAAVQATAEKASKTDVTEGQIAAQMKRARELATASVQIAQSGTQAQREAQDAAERTFTEGGVAQREALQRAKNAIQGVAQMQAQAAQESARLNKALATGQVDDAKLALDQLKLLQEQQLANTGSSQAKKLNIIKTTSKQIYDAEVAIAAAERDASKLTNQDEKDPKLRAALNARADRVYNLAVVAAQVDQQKAINAAQQSATTESEAAAKRAHDKAVASQKAQNALLAKLNEELRQGTIQQAQDTLANLSQLREDDLRDAKDNLVEKLRLTVMYGRLEYDAALKVAGAVRAAALRKAANDHTQNGNPLDDAAQAGAEAAAERAYALARQKAMSERDSSISTATTAVTSAVQQQRDAYSNLADSLRTAITAGTFDEAQRQAALVSFNQLGRATEKLGLTHKANVEGARQATYALIEEATGVDKATAAYEAYWKARAAQNNEGMADAGMRGSFGVGQEGLNAALTGSGANIKLLGDPQAALADLERFNKDAADRIRRVYADELAEFQHYHDSLNGSILETTTAAYAQIRQGMADEQAAADEANTTVESLTTMLQGVLANGLDPQTSGYVQLLDEIISKGGQAGVAAQQVKDNLDDLLNAAAAPSLQDVLGNPEAYSDGARDMPGNGPGPSVVAALQKQLDSQNADHLKTLSDAELKVAESEAMAGDEGEQLSLIFAEQKRRIDENIQSVSKLAAIQSQQARSTLEYQHGIKGLTDAEYLEQKAALDRIDAWQRWKDVVAANGDIKTATAQLWADLLRIEQDGVLARAAIEEEAPAGPKVRGAAATRLEVRRIQLEQERTALDQSHELELITDRQYQAARQQQDEAAAQAAYDLVVKNQGDTKAAAAQLEADLTRIRGQGVIDRRALDEAEINSYKDLAHAFGTFAAAMGEAERTTDRYGNTLATPWKNLQANIEGAVKAFETYQSIASDVGKLLASGGSDVMSWVHLATTVISSIADAIGGFKKAYAEAAQQADDFRSQFKLINADTFSSFTVRSRGWFADTFGGGPEVVKQIKQDVADIARTIESGVTGAFQNGIKNFLNGKGTFLQDLKTGIRDAIIDAIVQAVIQGSIIKGALGGLLTDLTNTLANGGDASSIIAQIGQTLPGLASGLEKTLQPLKDTLDRVFPNTTDTSSTSSGPTYGSGSSSYQGGTPQAVVDILGSASSLLKDANAASALMVQAANIQLAAAQQFGSWVQQLNGPHNSQTLAARP